MAPRVRMKTVGNYTLTATATDLEGDPATIATPVSIKVYDGGGTLIDEGTPSINTGVLSYDLAASKVTALDTYRADWTGRVSGLDQNWSTWFEVVGGHLFEVDELRAWDSAFSSKTTWPGSKIREARIRAEDRLEDAANLAFVPRGRRVTLSGSWRQTIALPDFEVRQIYAAIVEGTALDAEELAALQIQDCFLWRPIYWPGQGAWSGPYNVEVHYRHGLDYPPEPAKVAAMILAREYLVPKTLPSRAIGEQTDVGFLRYTLAGRDGATGIPEVDAVAAQFGRRGTGVG